MKRDSNVIFEGSVPENYDRYLGPVLFEPFAKDITARLKNRQSKRILELACGTGILTRQLRDSLDPAVRIVATDLNPGMLAFAQAKFRGDENVEWQEADAGRLSFPDKSFDAVVCQFGFMFVPDKESAMREAYRVLNSGGAFLFNVWDAMERNPFAQIAHKTIASFFNHDAPNFYELPFSFYDANLIQGLLQKAGFKAIESSLITLPCRSSSVAEFAIGLIRGNPVATAIQERGVKIDDVIEAVKQKIAERHGTGPVESTMQAFVWRALR